MSDRCCALYVDPLTSEEVYCDENWFNPLHQDRELLAYHEFEEQQ